MFHLHSAYLVVAFATTLVYAAGQDFQGPGLGGMSYYPYPSRSAYIPTGNPSSLGQVPVREAAHAKQFQPLLHDFHTPVRRDFGGPVQFPVRDIGINGGYPGAFAGPLRDIPFNNGFAGVHDPTKALGPQAAFNGVYDPIRNLGPQVAFGGVPDPTRNFAPQGAYGGAHDPTRNLPPQGAYGAVPAQLPPAAKGIDISAGPVPSDLTNKDGRLQNPAPLPPLPLSKDTVQGPGLGAYPNQVGKDIGYPGQLPGQFGGPFIPRGAIGPLGYPGFGPGAGLGRIGFGGFGAHKFAGPFLTPVSRFSGGYGFHRVPLALVQGGFVGHHFGTPVVHGIVKAGVPVSLARGW